MLKITPVHTFPDVTRCNYRRDLANESATVAPPLHQDHSGLAAPAQRAILDKLTCAPMVQLYGSLAHFIEISRQFKKIASVRNADLPEIVATTPSKELTVNARKSFGVDNSDGRTETSTLGNVVLRSVLQETHERIRYFKQYFQSPERWRPLDSLEADAATAKIDELIAEYQRTAPPPRTIASATLIRPDWSGQARSADPLEHTPAIVLEADDADGRAIIRSLAELFANFGRVTIKRVGSDVAHTFDTLHAPGNMVLARTKDTGTVTVRHPQYSSTDLAESVSELQRMLDSILAERANYYEIA